MAVNIAKLRDQARTYEARDQWREAIAAYRQILENPQGGGDVDIGLWNRIGDLHLRQNEQDRAVEAYESAVAAYVEIGLYNNAIALCRKILRLVPGRANVYRRLGQISAAKGFFADARQNFLEYADRMRRAGQIDAAFEALREFADLSPDDAEIRRVLADQLLSHGHPEEAVEQLRILLGMLISRGDEDAAEAVRQQILAIDASASTEPLARAAQAEVTDDFQSVYHSDVERGPAAPAADPRAGLSMGASLEDATSAPPTPVAIEGLEQSFDYSRPDEAAPAADEPSATDDLPLMDFGSGEDATERFGEVDLEPTSYAVDVTDLDAATDPEIEFGADLPLVDFGDDPATVSLDPPEGLEPTVADDFGTIDIGYGSVDLDSGYGTIDLPETAGEDLPLLDSGLPEPGVVDLPLIGEEDDALAADEWPVPTGAEPTAIPEVDLGAGSSAAEEAPVEVPPVEEPATSVASGGEPTDAALRVRLQQDPADHAARDELVDLLHERSDAEEALAVLEHGHRELADRGQWRDAIVPLSQLIRLRPGEDGPLLQKRVEYAFRSGERTAMVEAYMALARHFEAQDKFDKARAVYGRILEIEPPNPEARDAIAALESRAGAAQPAEAARPATDYIDLGALIFDDEVDGEASTRFIVEEREPTGDEDRDFADMLAHFRQKVAENIEVEDSSSHYDLGLAFKEMGLLDEAIAEFQVALRGGWDPLATLEMLGACFADKGQYAVATRVLERALRLPTTTDADLVGVLYQLGRSYESIGNAAQATEFYERVLSVDIRFRDTAARLDDMRGKLGSDQRF